MAYLLPVIVIIFGLAADAIVEVAAEISSDSLLDPDAGVDVPLTVPVVMDGLIDMRPEASIVAVASVDE